MTIPEKVDIIERFYITYRLGLNEQIVMYYKTKNGRHYYTDANACDDFKPTRTTKERYNERKRHAGETFSIRI